MGAAAAADDYRWIGQITEDGAALRYGIPESDAIKIDFHCDRATKKIAVSYEHEPKDAKDGMRLALRLSVKGRGATDSVAVAVTGERLALDDKFVLQGEIRTSPHCAAFSQPRASCWSRQAALRKKFRSRAQPVRHASFSQVVLDLRAFLRGTGLSRALR